MTKFFLLAVIFLNAIVVQAQNVGIGTTTPQSQLHIGNNGINELIIGRDKSAGGFTALLMGTSAVSNGYSYLQSVSSAGSQYGHLILNPTNGNVGIATINPQFKLDVRGGSINTDAAYCIGNAPILASPGNLNLFTGLSAGGANTTGQKNTANGSFTLYSNTTGSDNMAIGASALFSNSSGNYNTANGSFALYYNTTGDENTANGTRALYYNTTGSQNTAIGRLSLNNNTIGNDNTAIGSESLYFSTVGNQNTAIGSLALNKNTTGNLNTAMGVVSLYLNTTGDNNTAIGNAALIDNTSGFNNTAIGFSAGVSTGALTNATVIGNSATVNASNKIRLGNSSVTAIEGNVAYTFPSDGRFKTNITETVKGLDFIMQLRPVVYNFQAKKIDAFLLGKPLSDKRFAGFDYTGAENMRQSGFIAQEVEHAAKASSYDFNGVIVPKNEKETYALAYSQFVVPLVKAVQEQQLMILHMQKEIEELKRKNTLQK
jgi:trimeric autotransporter adhesin